MKSYLKRNKPLLLLPLILIPFIVLIFYVLGGGKLKQQQDQAQLQKDSVKGANYSLPDADRNIEIFDKLENVQSQKELTTTKDYDILGEKDSLPEASLIDDQTIAETSSAEDVKKSLELNPDVSNNLLAHIRQKEEQTRKDLLKGQEEARQNEPNVPELPEDKKALDKTVPQNQKTTGIEELDQVFNQNRELSRQNDSLNFRLQEAAGQLQKQEVRKNKRFVLEKDAGSGFKPSDQGESASSMIEAEIYETTTVLTGNRIKLRLMEDSWLMGIKIPANTFFYGTCEVENERLQIRITQIPVTGRFVPVEITVCDLDGLPGLYVPDNASRKVAKEVGSSTNTSSMMGVTNNPLTYAGIQAADKTAQSLLRMIKIKKVTIKKNTLVYLINKSN